MIQDYIYSWIFLTNIHFHAREDFLRRGFSWWEWCGDRGSYIRDNGAWQSFWDKCLKMFVLLIFAYFVLPLRGRDYNKVPVQMFSVSIYTPVLVPGKNYCIVSSIEITVPGKISFHVVFFFLLWNKQILVERTL